MSPGVQALSALFQSVIGTFLWCAVQLERLRRRLPRLDRRLRSSLGRLFERWRRDVGAPAEGIVRRFRAWNRTSV